MSSKKFDFIINKMNIPQSVAEEVMQYCSQYGTDKYAVWIAREANKVPDFNYNALNKIMDWAHSTSPNILSMSFNDAQKESDYWHENLEQNSTKEFAKRLSLDENRIVYRARDNKHFFYMLTPSELKSEGKYMGHCIGTNPFYASNLNKNKIQILSLRDENNLPHVTIQMTLQPDGSLNTSQISGKGNAVPVEKYLNLITEYGLYIISEKENKPELLELMNLMKISK